MRVWILLLSFCFALPSLAEDNWFDQGLKALQAKNWDQAKDAFEKAAQQNPNQPSVYYDLGLAYFQLNKKGYAVAYWRKALAMAPGLSAPATALDRAEEKYHFAQLDKSPWALALHNIFVQVGWNLWLGALALISLAAGWLWLGYFQKRKAAALSDSLEAPPVSWGLIFLAVIFVAALAANIGKFLDEQRPRATIVTTLDLKSAPSDDGVSLASVSEGSEVAVTRQHDDWVQINTGEGTSGWVKKSDLVMSDKGS